MSKITSYKKQQGFTLVELAIVLVIIGLIVSSVLVGQDLIKAAQLRATTRQLGDFQVGVNTFIGKYNGVPGDLLASTASTFQLVGAGVGADGDGVIEAVPADGAIETYTGEIANFWSALTTPGKELIAGTYRGTACSACTAGTDFPAMKFGSAGWGVYGNSSTGENFFYAGAASPSTTTATTMVNPFIPADAYNIDVKIDDGLPNSGDVRAGGAVLTTFTTSISPLGTCVSSSAYLMTTTVPACGLQFKMQTF